MQTVSNEAWFGCYFLGNPHDCVIPREVTRCVTSCPGSVSRVLKEALCWPHRRGAHLEHTFTGSCRTPRCVPGTCHAEVAARGSPSSPLHPPSLTMEGTAQTVLVGRFPMLSLPALHLASLPFVDLMHFTMGGGGFLVGPFPPPPTWAACVTSAVEPSAGSVHGEHGVWCGTSAVGIEPSVAVHCWKGKENVLQEVPQMDVVPSWKRRNSPVAGCSLIGVYV